MQGRAVLLLLLLACVVCCAVASSTRSSSHPSKRSPAEHRRRMQTHPLNRVMHNATARRIFCSQASLIGLSCEKDYDTDKTVAEYVRRHGQPSAAALNPVVLFPGLAGSGLQARIYKSERPAWGCFKTWLLWWEVWVSLYEGLFQTCLFDNLRLYYNASTDTYHNTPGVQIRPTDFGGLRGVSKLDHFDDPFDLTEYYAPVIRALEGIGYRGGTNLFGAPYDWRLPVDKLMASDILMNNKTYEQNLIELIEMAYNTSGGLPANLVTHSMGGPTVLYFLNRRTREWKEKYIAAFIPIAGPFAGALKALKSMISGDNLGLHIPILDISLLSLKDIAENFRGQGGAAYLAPDSDYYPKDQVFVTRLNPPRNYTSSDFAQMFIDLGAPGTGKMMRETQNLISDLHHPMVNSYCLYGWGHKTEIHLTYDSFSSDPNKVTQPVSIDTSDKGDGTVPLYSLIECKNWVKIEKTRHEVNCKEYDLRDHSAILKDDELHLDLLEIVTGKSNIKGCKDIQTPKFMEAVEEMNKYRQGK